MRLARRVAAFVCLTAAASGVALWATRETLRPRDSPQEVGLRWLKDEYHIDDATFEKISVLHRDYFRQCEKMCRQIKETDRSIVWPGRHRDRRGPGDLAAQANRSQAVCGSCENIATEHLKRVAALISGENGQRYLDHVLPILRQQHRLHDENLFSNIR